MLHSRSFHKKLMKLAKGSFHNFINMKNKQKKKKKKVIYSPANPTFHYIKWGLSGCSLHGLVNIMTQGAQPNAFLTAYTVDLNGEENCRIRRKCYEWKWWSPTQVYPSPVHTCILCLPYNLAYISRHMTALTSLDFSCICLQSAFWDALRLFTECSYWILTQHPMRHSWKFLQYMNRQYPILLFYLQRNLIITTAFVPQDSAIKKNLPL